MSFLSPWFLLGLLAVTIPLLLHLSHRQQAERIVFSTMRFVPQTAPKMVFLRRLQQWLLLLLRAAIIALLALAFSRPFLSGAVSELAGSAPRSVVILLDTSMSMAYGDVFAHGKKAALDIITALQPADEAAVATFADSAGEVRALTTDSADLTAFVTRLKAPGFQSTRYLPALRLADQMLRAARYEAQTIYLISDYRGRPGADFNAAWRLRPGVHLQTVRVGDDPTTNLAVTDVRSPTQLIRDQDEHVIVARVRNLGSQPLPGAQVSLHIDGDTVDSKTVHLTPEAGGVVQFRTVLRKRGVHRGTVRVADDAFAADNAFRFTVHVVQPLAILVVSGGSEMPGGAADTTWLASAIGKPGSSLFRLEVIRPEQVNAEAMRRYRVIVLLNVRHLSETQMQAIRSHVARGGGLLMAPADRVAAQPFNHLMHGLVPALLVEQRVASDHKGWVIASVNARHPVIKALQQRAAIDFGRAQFGTFWSTTQLAGSDVLMRFDNAQAALLERVVGKGRVMLFTSSLDTRWNDLPLQATFVPLLYETLRYLALHEDKQRAYSIGDTVLLRVPERSALRVTDPAGGATILTAAAGGEVFYNATHRPGFYTVRSGNLDDVFAVNVAAAESDLATRLPADFGVHFVNRQAKTRPGGEARVAMRNAQLEQSQQLWWWLLLGVLLLGLLETHVANRTERQTSVTSARNRG